MVSSMTPIRIVTFAVCVALLTSGCERAGEPLLPPGVVEEVNQHDRERNYDLAWQDIAAINGAIGRNDFQAVGARALLAAGRVARLAAGEVDLLDNRRERRLVANFSVELDLRSRSENMAYLNERGQELRSLFDMGEFEDAVAVALDLWVVAQALHQSRPAS